MNIHFKILATNLAEIREDLQRPHDYAAERVGFISCKLGSLPCGGITIIAGSYHPVDDGHYLKDPHVGAMMGPGAIRYAMQHSYNYNHAMFHVHLHHHFGQPRFSSIDLDEAENFVPDFWNVKPGFPHGIIVLSLDSLYGLCWVPGADEPVKINRVTVVGSPLLRFGSYYDG